MQEAHRFQTIHEEYNCWPLEQLHRNRIIRNQDQLVELLECEHSGLIGTLFQSHCINRQQMRSITQVASTDNEKTMQLLTMLKRRSIKDYTVFVEFLNKSEDMRHLACLFEEDVVVETVDCTIASTSSKCVREVEDEIVSRFRAVERLRSLIRRLIHRDCHPNTDLAAMKVGHSIRCFFFCGTPDALQHLYISINNGSLIATMQSIFQQLLGCEESVFVVKITGQLNLHEQSKRVEEFCTEIGSVTSNELSEAAMSGFTKPFMLPYDVLEPILLQVAVKLFKRNQVRLLEPRPDVASMLTISRVCKDWFQVITGRRILRRKLKFTFRKSTIIPTEVFKAAVLLRHRLIDQPMALRFADVTVLKTVASVCHRWMMALGESGDLKRLKQLFHYNPQLLISFSEPPTDSDGHPLPVRGVAILENFVYVVYGSYNKVEVFDCEDYYKKVKDIGVKGLEDPRDMVGSSVTSQLFISGWHDVIRRVDLTTRISDVFIKLDDICYYEWLSLVKHCLLVTSRDSLLMYDIQSGEKIKKIPFPEEWYEVVYHAIESNRDSFFVNHGLSGSTDTVSEIDSEGREIRVFNNERHHCGDLTLDSVGRLLVTYWNTSCVVLFDEHLKFKRILFDNKRLDNSQARRLDYNENNDRLAVGLVNGKVKIFECDKCCCG